MLLSRLWTPWMMPLDVWKSWMDCAGLLAVRIRDDQLCLGACGHLHLHIAVYVAVSMTRNGDRLCPSGDERGDAFYQDRVRKTVPSSMARMVPFGDFHISLEVILLHTGSIRRDGGALDGHTVFSW